MRPALSCARQAKRGAGPSVAAGVEPVADTFEGHGGLVAFDHREPKVPE